VAALHPDLETHTSFDHVLNGASLDAVAIATPAPCHYDMAKRCLLAGKHTFVEKPMAMSSTECDELVRIAEERGLVLMVGHTYLYSNPVVRIKEIVDRGDIGTIRYISSRRLNLGLFHTDINVVWDLAPHDLSVILYLVGELPSTVNCQGQASVTPGIEDVANLALHFPSGVYATIHNSWLDPKKTREMTIVGSKRMIVYDDLEPLQKIKVYDMRVDTPPHYDTFADFQYAYHYGDMHVPHVSQSEPLRVECEHFIDCIDNGTNPISSGRQGRDLVRIIEAANASMRQGGTPVEMDFQGQERCCAGSEGVCP